MSSNVKTAVFWVVIICAVVLVWMAVKTGRGTPPRAISVSEFVSLIQSDQVREADVTGTDVAGTPKRTACSSILKFRPTIQRSGRSCRKRA